MPDTPKKKFDDDEPELLDDKELRDYLELQQNFQLDQIDED